ncbi:ATP-binding protein [Candidatus Thiosymbion oneisti]|uniref:ATP-binding protein n=1 Tax=Candidatus Thiosymbion oneisti TaxID=589554 RepID=UPI000B7ED252|nr:ATP-binding protein [Candidatus Thiosymbion oneisti]
MKTAPNIRSVRDSTKHSLSGHILPARIIKVGGLDSCDLDLLKTPDGPVLARGRLYQSESIAWQDGRLLSQLPEYQRGKLLPKVFVNNQRVEQGKPLWFVHERWGQENPWEDLCLTEDDCISGNIVRRISSPRRSEPVGYIIQLDIDQLLLRTTRLGMESSEYTQPDIEAFLPVEEIPWADGSLGVQPEKAGTQRLRLEIGDPIRALIVEIRPPPDYPKVSLCRLIHHLDATAERAFEHADTLARWRFLNLLGNPASADSAKESIEPAALDDKPYAGKRLLLVDDDEEASTSQAEILGLMGAEVSRILVRSNMFGEAVSEVRRTLQATPFDLVLVDNNLPGRDLGQLLVERVVVHMGNDNPVRLVLLTANAALGGTAYDRDVLRTKGLVGLVHRPLTHQALQRLLAGDEVWEEEPTDATTSIADAGVVEARLAGAATPTPRALLEDIAAQPGIRFAVLLRAKQHIEARDLIGVGSVPFEWHDYPDVMARTELRLLATGRRHEIDIKRTDGGNELLRVGRDGVAYWRVLELGATPWIFGLGVTEGHDIEVQLNLWCSALTAALEVQAWRDWGRHVSSFVQLGMAHSGLSHEVFHLQGQVGDLLYRLGHHIAEIEPEVGLRQEDKEALETTLTRLERTNQELLEFSKHQLREQALRHREVFLPDAVVAIRRIVESECRETEVDLHLGTPPTLAIPAPNAALILPIVNLLINAAKHHYRAENRRVELLFNLEESDTSSTLIVDVRDNGPGLDQGTLERLWEPGFSTAKDLERRHGMGLWLSRRLIEEAGGSLELYENWRELGAWFRLRLPIHLG